ncbi:TIGR02328 family protein [Enterococcus sp. AZ196]|uniref:TIGR02328 family protein n=1 Tax=Enterococcus sp. AZ196 TaxID=2774659 RepID=UPI003D2A97B2
MRLWHEALIPLLPRQQLLGQHREVAALRGKGWGKKHATVDYAFVHPYYKLYQFHLLVMEEMKRRGYAPDSLWYDPLYRGKKLPPMSGIETLPTTRPLYPEHDESYLEECLSNLAQKGVYLSKP